MPRSSHSLPWRSLIRPSMQSQPWLFQERLTSWLLRVVVSKSTMRSLMLNLSKSTMQMLPQLLMELHGIPSMFHFHKPLSQPSVHPLLLEQLSHGRIVSPYGLTSLQMPPSLALIFLDLKIHSHSWKIQVLKKVNSISPTGKIALAQWQLLVIHLTAKYQHQILQDLALQP